MTLFSAASWVHEQQKPELTLTKLTLICAVSDVHPMFQLAHDVVGVFTALVASFKFMIC